MIAASKVERLAEAERGALLETGHAVHRQRWDAHCAAEQARLDSLAPDELRALAEASVGSWMEQEENECWERANARVAAGIVPEPRAPAPPPPTHAQIIAEREAFMAKFIG